MKTANGLDSVVVLIYLGMILAVGVVFMRLNRGGSDYFRGGNRIPWLVASLSAFMSGFSAFTFTGMAGIAYKDGLERHLSGGLRTGGEREAPSDCREGDCRPSFAHPGQLGEIERQDW